MRKENGITLIALVITMIVLLILACVTIITLTGDNGILQKVGEAKDTNIEAEGLERIQLAVMASRDENGINTASLAKNLSEITGLTDTNDNEISKITKIALPKSIKFNNFKYKIKEDGTVVIDNLILPEEYQEVEYIESTGGQKIILPNVNTNAFKIKTKVYQNKFSVESCICGNLKYIGNDGYLLGIANHSGMHGVELYTGKTQINDNIYFEELSDRFFIIDVEFSNVTKKLIANDIEKQGIGSDYLSSNYEHQLFGRGEMGNSYFVGRIYYFEYYSNTYNLNLIPCYRKADEIIGMYDTVEGKFYTNQGSGEFIAGPDV